MWVLALLLILISSLLFVFNQSISTYLSGFIKVNKMTTLIKAVATVLFGLALAINIVHWKTESAVVLTATLFGPFMFFAIFNKPKANK